MSLCPSRKRLPANSGVDFPHQPSNNPPMPRPDAVRRVKSYSAADGYVYQYYFFEGNRAQRSGSPGGAWAKLNGRPLTSSEEYAVAKMRLFQAFDEGSVQAPPDGQQAAEVLVDESNLEEFLKQLGI